MSYISVEVYVFQTFAEVCSIPNVSGGNEYGQCGEEPERKDDTGRPLRRDIVIPQRCAPKLLVRQVIYICQCY